jgi:hypothetical protein
MAPEVDFNHVSLLDTLIRVYMLVDRLHGSQRDLSSTPLDIHVESMPPALIIGL